MESGRRLGSWPLTTCRSAPLGLAASSSELRPVAPPSDYKHIARASLLKYSARLNLAVQIRNDDR